MSTYRRLFAVLPAATVYLVAASINMAFERYSGGVIFLWAGTAIVIADLSPRPTREWPMRLPGFLAASFLACMMFGMGWPNAVPISLNNLLEALIAAKLLSMSNSSRAPIGSLAWLTGFVIPVGIVAPMIVGTWMVGISLLTGRPPLSVLPGIVGGHAFGNLCFTPLAMLVGRGGFADFRAHLRGRVREASVLLALVVVVSTGVFAQDHLPLLFLPILPLILVSFRLGHGASGVAVLVVGAIGTTFTLCGMGPVQLVHTSLGDQLLFLQFFFATTILTALPVAADLEIREQLHRDVRFSEQRYRLIAEHSTDVLMHLELDGHIRYVSPSIKQLAGYDPETLIGSDGMMLVAPAHVDEVRRNYRATAAAGGADHSFEFLVATATGEERWFETHARAVIAPGGAVDGLLFILRDISARKATEDKLEREATTDPLTGLPNRRGFEKAAAAWKASDDGTSVDCVAVFDVDHFKRVNDRFGHDAGDAVLRCFGTVMRRVVRQGDAVARTGGEEFAVLFPRTSIHQALTVCDRLRTEMAGTFTHCGNHAIRVTVSGGVALLDSRGLDHALKEADKALYEAKRGGRDQMRLAA